MNLKEKVTYSDFTYGKDGLLFSVDMTFEGKTTKVIIDMLDCYWEEKGNFVYENTIASDMLSSLIVRSFVYFYNLDRDPDGLTEATINFKKYYNVLLDLLGCSEKVKLATREVLDLEMAILCDFEVDALSKVGTYHNVW